MQKMSTLNVLTFDSNQLEVKVRLQKTTFILKIPFMSCNVTQCLLYLYFGPIIVSAPRRFCRFVRDFTGFEHSKLTFYLSVRPASCPVHISYII